jgi:hypothetical protein
VSKSKPVLRTTATVDVSCSFCRVRRNTECGRFECPKREHLTANIPQYDDSSIIGEGCSVKTRKVIE